MLYIHKRFKTKNPSVTVQGSRGHIDLKWKEILGRGGKSKQSHIIALEQLNSNTPVTASKINEIFKFCNISTNEKELNKLLNIPGFEITNLNRRNIIKKVIKDKLGLPSAKHRVPGVYIFTHIPTGKKYVGSSKELATRLTGYINFSHRASGLLVPLLIKERLRNFSLQVFPFFDNYIRNSELVLEQYYLLDPSFNLNTVRVANNPSGSNIRSLYMYNRDKSILFYSANQQIDFIRKFHIHHSTFTKHLNNGTYYLGKYIFLREPVLTAKVAEIKDDDLANILAKDRVKFNKNKPVNGLSKPVELIDKWNNTIIFTSLGKCIKYLRNQGLSADQRTLIKYINLGITYKGYKCRFI